MTKRVCILLFLCSALVACTREDPVDAKKGDVPPRLQTSNDPVDYLNALQAADEALQRNPKSTEALFQRAQALETLGLRKEAIRAWDEVVKKGPPKWAPEANHRRTLLMNVRDPEWHPEQLTDALKRRDRAALTQIVRMFPYDAAVAFEESNLLDLEASRLFAEVLDDPYARAVVNSVASTKDRKALEEGLAAFKEARARQQDRDHVGALAAYERAASLLERAGCPLFLSARYGIAPYQSDPLPVLDSLIPPATKLGARNLSSRAYAFRANALEFQSRYLEAYPDYSRALDYAGNDPTAVVNVLGRRSANYLTIGRPETAFADSLRAVHLTDRIADVNALHHAFGPAAAAASQLGYDSIALHYHNAFIDLLRTKVLNAPAERLGNAKTHLAIALQKRADTFVALKNDDNAEHDLQEATSLAEAAHAPVRDLLKLRSSEVQGQALLDRDPAGAVDAFTKAIQLATAQDSTYRAVLYYKRATARQKAGQSNADADIATALEILRDEAALLRNTTERGKYEALWTPYFSRFQSMYREMVESRLAENDIEGAFVYAEQARAFEPMQLLLQSDPGFRKIDTVRDLRRHLATLPADTLILQYLVFPDKTYVWLVTNENISVIRLSITGDEIKRWVTAILREAPYETKSEPRELSAAYALFRDALKHPSAKGRARLVIVPHDRMHGLPFAGLKGTDAEGGRLIQRGSIAVAGSTSLYFYALHRDNQLASDRRPSVLIVGDPISKLGPLELAREEAQQLGLDYTGAETLIGAQATTKNFLASAKNKTIVHFAGHAVPSPQMPWSSRLLLTRDGSDSGELTAERLMQDLFPLTRTRLVVLGACSTAPGDLVGPEGVAPLVRPFIAATVPGVVSTLWDVRDATAKQLLVSLHCHYRNGDDVAVALQKAQLDMLREPATKWAAYQVVGYAGSPYAHNAGMEKTHSERVCSENSFHGPDGLRSQ